MGTPARRIEVPAGFPLSSEQIVALLEGAAERIAGGQPGFDVMQDTPEWYHVKIPVGAALEKDEVLAILTVCNRGKEAGYGDALFTFDSGKLVKRWLTLKDTGTGMRLNPAGPVVGG